MNNASHAFPGNKDFVCTKGIQFRVLNERLFIHVAMRSSDAVFGIATDLPCFWTLWEMVGCALGLPLGEFIFSADSIHIYEKHFQLAANIIKGEGKLIPISIPAIINAQDLISGRFESEYGQWLTTAKL